MPKEPLATIGLDPGIKSALAVWVDTKLRLVRGVVRATPEMRQQEIQRFLVPGALMEFVSEGQVLGENDPGRFVSILKTADSASRWEEHALMAGIPVADRVLAQSWRATFGLGQARFVKQRAKVARKAMESLVGTLVWTEDMAEATLLAFHRHLQRAAEYDVRLCGDLVVKQRRIRDAITTQGSGSGAIEKWIARGTRRKGR